MKLFIINGENNDEKIEIQIKESLMVEDIRCKLDEILHGNGKLSKDMFQLIHKNRILFDSDSIKRFTICENDEIWFGMIENYLRNDDVVVYVFHVGVIYDDECLIVNRNDTISTIKSIIERIFSEIINIWNADGKEMKNDQFVTEIDKNENYKLIIRCDDGEENVTNNTFDECCFLHDSYWVDKYLFFDRIRDDNKNDSRRTILINLINQIKQITLSNDIIDDRLNQNLSDLSSSFLNSKILVYNHIRPRIVDICDNYSRSVKNQYEDDVVKIFDQYFKFAIRSALCDFLNIRQQNINKSVRDIVIESLDHFVKYLIDSSNDWQYWLRLMMNQYLLGPFSDSDLNERIDKYKTNKFTIKIRMNRENRDNFLPFKAETIFEVKKLISEKHKVDMKHLCCIKPGGDHKPNDEDTFDDEFIIEIVLSMDDIEILRSLGRGAFARIYLCRDKTSNKQFALKKPIRKDGDLYRDINIYSKLNSSRNIMNYSGLFRDGESICICMEYMSGGSLRSYLNNVKHLSEQEIVKFSYEILTQINDLHKLGIIHRDINCLILLRTIFYYLCFLADNIVLDEHNHAKLIDFGISKYKSGMTSKDLLDKLKAYSLGSIRYMAPELIKEEQYSEKIDIWSFGMVMVEMVTGKRPFHWLELPIQAIPKIRDCAKYEFESIPPISNELNQFIDSCLNTTACDRPSAEQLINSELFKFF